MGFLSNLVGGGAVSVVKGFADVIDTFVETDEEKKAAELVKAKLMAEPMLAQIELNKIEAQHRTVFVAGWRPFIGWVCGVALLWHFVLYDMLVWMQASFFPGSTVVPRLGGTETLVTVVLSLLGLGAFRTAEKMTGKAR